MNIGGEIHMAQASILSTRACLWVVRPTSMCLLRDCSLSFSMCWSERPVCSDSNMFPFSSTIPRGFLALGWVPSSLLKRVFKPSSIVRLGFLLFFMRSRMAAYSIRAANTKKIQTTRYRSTAFSLEDMGACSLNKKSFNIA